MDTEETPIELIQDDNVPRHGEGRVGYGKRGESDAEKKTKRENRKAEIEARKREMELVLGMYLEKRELRENGNDGWKEKYSNWVSKNISRNFVDLGEEDVEYPDSGKIVHKESGLFETVEPGSESLLLGKLHERLTDHIKMWKVISQKEVKDIGGVGERVIGCIAKFRELDETQKSLLKEKYPKI